MTIDNLYLAAFEACEGERYDTDSDNRAALVRRYAWAVPTRSAVLAIVARGPVVEIGAGSTGCTGDDAFHARLHSLTWEYETSCQLPNWSGNHDYMSIRQRAL